MTGFSLFLIGLCPCPRGASSDWLLSGDVRLAWGLLFTAWGNCFCCHRYWLLFLAAYLTVGSVFALLTFLGDYLMETRLF